MKSTSIFILKVILISAALISPSINYAAMAMWTGRQEAVTTVTYQSAWRCEYAYGGQTFWKIFTGYCPPSIDVY